MEDYDNSDVDFKQGKLLGTPYYTPYHNQVSMISGLQPLNIDLSAESSNIDLSAESSSDSSVASLKEGSKSPSSPSWDSDPEYVIPPVNISDMEQQNQLVGEEKANASMLWERENRSYDGLLKKFIENEEELRVSNYKLQLSEEEVFKLKSQIEKSELELQKQTAELRTHVPDCHYKISKLMQQLEVANTQLKKSDDKIARLTKELGFMSSETHHLQGKVEVAEENVAKLECQFEELEEIISWYKSNEISLELEVQNLKAEILDAQKLFTIEKDMLYSNIMTFSAMGIELNSQMEEWEARSNALENKLRQTEAEILEQKELYVGEKMVWQHKVSSLKEELCMRTCELEVERNEAMLQVDEKLVLQGEINSLKEELDQRRHNLEALNKEFERYKLKFDMLMKERDEANAKIDKLKAVIPNMEEDLLKLQFGYETSVNLTLGLKLKVEELEKEMTRRDEEKREAIRQLCFSLEYYRGGYQELVQAFAGQKRHAVMAT